MIRWAIFILMFAVFQASASETSFCDKVIPLQPGFITKYNIKVNVTEREPPTVLSMSMFARPSHDKPGRVEIIFKDFDTCVDCTQFDTAEIEKCRSRSVPELQRRLYKTILEIECRDDATQKIRYNKRGPYDKNARWSFGGFQYWLDWFSYDAAVIDALKNNETQIIRDAIMGESKLTDCPETSQLNYDNAENFKVSRYYNSSNCAGDPGDGTKFVITNELSLDRTTFTMKLWERHVIYTFDRKKYPVTSYMSSAKFDQLLPIESNEDIFDDRAIPDNVQISDQNPELEFKLSELLSMKQGLDQRWNLKAKFWDLSVDFDLIFRPTQNLKYILVRSILPTGEKLKKMLPDEATRNIFNHTGIFRFNPQGGLLYNFLGNVKVEDIAPKRSKYLTLDSARLDLESIRRLKSHLAAKTDASEMFTSTFRGPWADEKDEDIFDESIEEQTCEAHHSITKLSDSAYEVKMSINECQQEKLSSKYGLQVTHHLRGNDLSLIDYGLEVMANENGYKKIVDIQLTFVEDLARVVNDNSFEVFGQLVGDTWFSERFVGDQQYKHKVCKK